MKKYAISHIISSTDISGGGPSKSVSDLAINQALQGQKAVVFTKASAQPYLIKSPHPNLQIKFVQATPFKKALDNFLESDHFDVLHGHGIWQMPVHHMAKLAIKKNIPYIITPRGMLEPWALKQGKIKKKLALSLYQYSDIANATCIHATATMEAKQIRRLGFTNPIAVIPNGIELSQFPLIGRKKENKKKRTLLFLSRIHPKKGIELLIEAWSNIDLNLRQDWQIKIAGNGEKAYTGLLKKKLGEKGLQDEIEFIGPQYGKNKLLAYREADLFVLPTYSENFGIVIAEAMASEVPVITTKGTPWEELTSSKSGWWIDIGVEALHKTLQEALLLESDELKKMGERGRKLIEKNYSIESVAERMIEVYEWILNKGEKPSFVFNED